MAEIAIPDYAKGATMEDVWAMFREAGEKQKEDRESMKELRESQKETERLLKETQRIVARNSRQMGGLHNSIGELVEHLVTPGTVKRFNEIGFHFTDVSPGGRKFFDEQGKVRTQVDILLENGESIMAVEVKTKWHKKDIGHHLRRLEILREIKDKAGDKRKIYGAIALAMGSEVEKEAVLEAGLYLLEQSGDTIQLNLPDGFVPREW
jgi:ribosomal protein L9